MKGKLPDRQRGRMGGWGVRGCSAYRREWHVRGQGDEVDRDASHVTLRDDVGGRANASTEDRLSRGRGRCTLLVLVLLLGGRVGCGGGLGR